MRDAVMVGLRLERDNRDHLAAVAKRAGISASELMDQLITHMELTDQGIPPWLPEKSRDGELDIDAA